MSALDRLSLIQWLSPAFPTGGFAYSHGLEQAMADGARDADAVSAWVADVLRHGGGWVDAVLLSLVLRGEDAGEIADLARALAGSAERLAETMDQGRAFAATVSALSDVAQPARPLPVALGEAARRLALPPEEVVAHYLHAFAANLISAATRFLPLGQAEAQAALARLHPLIAALAAEAATAGHDRLESCCFGADLAAMRHETLEVRIFRT
ncbi:urease accessory protein UreF [Paracoccus sp. MKU1]|uniref:urease accessory protein UreF n=1 Tax=Paracoccus sp. MKU1 TaxID=1745182 RepID=UPI0007194196|nr:urease accessory UreF family protein [Paracoccus sp. MKU1]KRW94925.1 urease accessory protein UreF [Paracoccus sp. MKU1]